MAMHANVLAPVVLILGLVSDFCFMRAKPDKIIHMRDSNGWWLCEYPSNKSIMLLAVGFGCIFLGAIVAHVVALGELRAVKELTTYQRVKLGICYFVAWASTIAVAVMASCPPWERAKRFHNPSWELSEQAHKNDAVLCTTKETIIYQQMRTFSLFAASTWITFIWLAILAKKQAEQIDNRKDKAEESEMTGPLMGAQAHEGV
eukprot:TRINITY_DN33376_c0_g1_i1.p1 TRINITY_DN33376_c0_g1~~TRINITY_DN33376_c0_g1_i1.p1  ORF type:complete len:203 (-),score=26.92 TRINITY_DN33376_c0_g1_i1:738-1346(-)